MSFVVLLLSELHEILIPATAIAADSAKSTSSPAGGLGLLAWIACYYTRKKDIGGWLLYYFITLYIGILFQLANHPEGSQFIPQSWDSMFHYLPFILTTVPVYFLTAAQFILSLLMWSSLRRKWKHIELLQRVLILQFGFSLLSIAVAWSLWPQAIVYEVIHAPYSAVWFIYFTKSLRVELVFRPDRSWDWDELHRKKYIATK